jgi:ABC-2 type transport system ATP-binding protein
VSPALSIDHLDVRFGEVAAVSDVSLHLDEGTVLGFVGPNGAGKTTTMRAVFGLVEPAGGSLRWADAPIGPAQRRTFGYMPEERGLYAKMRVHDQLRYFGRLHGMRPADAARAATATIERLDIEQYADRPLATLSLGNQQRVQLGVSLVHRPPLLVLDEPFSGLDPMGVEVMAGALAEERDRGASILFSSHQLELVERLSDRVAILLRGSLAAEGTLEQLRARDAERRFVVEVPGAPDDWWHGVEHVRPLQDAPAPADGRPVARRFLVDRPGAERALLQAAERTGHLVAFGPDRPSLARIFRDLVA